jgi:hypothetical protein
MRLVLLESPQKSISDLVFSSVPRKAKFDCAFVVGEGRPFSLRPQTSPQAHWRPSAVASEGGLLQTRHGWVSPKYRRYPQLIHTSVGLINQNGKEEGDDESTAPNRQMRLLRSQSKVQRAAPSTIWEFIKTVS